MSFWNRSPGASSPKRNIRFPVREELVSGALTATIHNHAIETMTGPIPCWSYVTEGLAAHGQKEVVFTLRREETESVDSFPQEPLHLFKTFHQLALQGRRVELGGFTQFGARDFLGGHLIYIRPQAHAELKLSPSTLLALLVTKDEVLASQSFGCLRLMSRLGEASRFYPCPQWSERRRAGVSFDSTRQSSVLSKVAHVSVPGTRIRQSGNQLTLECHRNAIPQFESAFSKLPSNVPVAFLTELDPSADGCLVWQPGQTEPAAITPPGSSASCLCGCFALFVPGQPRDCGKLVEDGFALMLTVDSWDAIRKALSQGEEVTVPSTIGMSLSVSWWEDEYVNPIDGSRYLAVEGWKTYRPVQTLFNEGGKKEGRSRCSIRLLTDQKEMARRITIDAMAAFCTRVRELVDQHFVDCGPGAKLLVEFQCTPDTQEIRILHAGNISEVMLQAFHDSLQSIDKLPVSEGEVRFQVETTFST